MEKALIIIGFLCFGLIGCEIDLNTNFDKVDSFDLMVEECYSSINESTICMDSILTDSRCPEFAYCAWEGNASVQFSLTLDDQQEHEIILNTNPNFALDTTIGNFYILMSNLDPYPQSFEVIDPEEYKAELIVADTERLKNNAQILKFSPEKKICTWGWTIKVGNKTIKSEADIIGKLIGYNVEYPIDVYVELGDLEQTCNEPDEFDYYGLEKLIKIE